MPEIIAVRRNLSPGAVFFRQIGRVVEYSLDQVTWYYAFELPRGSVTQISGDVFNSFADMTIQQFVEFNTSIYNTPNGISPTTIDDIAAGAGKIERNLCSASKALAIAVGTLVNALKEEAGDEKMRWDAAVTRIVGRGVAVGAFVGWKTKFLTPKVAGFLGFVVGAMEATADIIDFVTALDNVPDLLDADDIDVVACYIYRRVQTNPSMGREALANSLYLAQLPDLPMLPVGTADAFHAVMMSTPEVYSHFLAMTLDTDEATCECGGCIILKPWDAEIINNSGYKLLNGGVKTTPTYAPYAPTNWKYLWLRYNIPTGQQVDYVTVNYTTSQYLKSSSLGWGTNRILAVSVYGLYNAPPITNNARLALTITGVSDYTVSNTTNSGGVKSFTFDFSGITFENGTTGQLDLSHRTAYAVSGLGADTIFTGGKICFRGP